MPTNPMNGVEVPLSLFGGLDTDLSAPDLPEGVSPFNQDVVYLPGSVGSRPGLRRRFASGTMGLDTVAYLKPVVSQAGGAVNLIFRRGATQWTLDFELAGAVNDAALGTDAGQYCKSCSAFSREFIAISNGFQGTTVPFKADFNSGSTNAPALSGVGQEGPGASPTVADLIESATITSIAANGVTITSATSATSPDGASATVTAVTSAAHGLAPGQTVEVVGTSHPRYNVEAAVNGVPSTTSFTYTIDLFPIAASAIGRVNSVNEIASAPVPHQLVVGDVVAVSGGQDGSFDGSATVTVIPSTVQWEYASFGGPTTLDPAPPPAGLTFVPTQLSASTGGAVYSSATADFSALPANASAGDPISISGAVGAGSTHPFDSNVGGNPEAWTILSITGTAITFSITGIKGLTAANPTTTGGTATVGGLSSPGMYQATCFYITKYGYLSKPAPPFRFNSQGGTKFQVTNIPTNPSPGTIIGTAIALTGAGGGAFFYLPVSVTIPSATPGGEAVIIPSTVVTGGASSAVLNIADNELFAGTALDINGNNLFGLVRPGPCLGFAFYGDRTISWGGLNRVTNLLNMSLDGGFAAANTPSGWTVASAGAIVPVTDIFTSESWRITGDGSASKLGQLQQAADFDAFGVPILQPLTAYTFQASIDVLTASQGGNITCDIVSADASTTYAIATMAIPALTGITQISGTLAAMPAAIPTGMLLRVYAEGQVSGGQVAIYRMSIFDTLHPVEPFARISYAANPESFDGGTGVFQISSDQSPIQCVGQVRDNLVVLTRHGMHYTTAQAGEPSDWPIFSITHALGALGPWAMDGGVTGSGDSGEEWVVFASDGGMYIYSGGEPIKITQELQPNWARINPAAAFSVWVASDNVERRIYCGVPLDAATGPSAMLVLDRKELNSADAIANNGPIRISFTGKMIASDITRKWTVWSPTIAYGATAWDANGELVMQFGSGAGVAPGVEASFGEVYTLDPTFLTDDDYGQIQPIYTTYFYVNHEQEQQLQLGAGRKVYKQAAIFARGTGVIQVTPLADSPTNPWPASLLYPLTDSPTQDIAIGLNVSTERMALQIASFPQPGTTDNGFLLSKIALLIATHPVTQTVGSVV